MNIPLAERQPNQGRSISAPSRLTAVVDQPVGETSGRDCLRALRKQAPQVLPSLLLCDFGNLEREIERLERAGVQALHLDVMDGNFVSNLTYGFPIVQAVSQLTDLTVDVHLMIERPERYVEQFVEAGADTAIIHAEAVANPRPLLEKIRSLGAGAGLAINPDTPLDSILDCLDVCDTVLVMSVNPGFGGQAFEPGALEKLSRLKSLTGDSLCLEVDGGVNVQTIGPCSAAGADLFVVGSAIFNHTDYTESVAHLTTLARENRRA